MKHQPSLFDPEIWKVIPTMGKRYSVSNHGRVRNNITGKLIAAVENASRDGAIYHRIYMDRERINGKRRRVRVMLHCLVAAVHQLGRLRIPYGYEVHHIDHDRLNNRMDNLKILTIEEHGKRHRKDFSEAEESQADLQGAF